MATTSSTPPSCRSRRRARAWTGLDAFAEVDYPDDVVPGVYDIHSPRVPTTGEMLELLFRAAAAVPVEQLWVNPDCGLKTRGWPEVEAALVNMVEAARLGREQLTGKGKKPLNP